MSKTPGRPAPRTEAELQCRLEAMNGGLSLSRQILDSFTGGYPAGAEPSVPVRGQDGSCFGRRQWTYTREDASTAERVFHRMVRTLGEGGWRMEYPSAADAEDPSTDVPAQGDAVVVLTPDEHEAGAGVMRPRGEAAIRISAAWERDRRPRRLRPRLPSAAARYSCAPLS